MATTLYVDTSTTGRWNYSHGASDDSQPYMARLSWLLEAADFTTISEACHLIRLPSGVRMANEAAFATGIFDHALDERGIGLPDVLTEFCGALETATRVVAFGWEDRRRVLERSFRLLHQHIPIWPTPGCAMIRSTNIVQIPSQRPGSAYKWPSWDQACGHFLGARIPWSDDPVASGFAKVRAVRSFWTNIRIQGGDKSA